MRNITYSLKLTELIKNINFEILMRHYIDNIKYFSSTKYKYSVPSIWNMNITLCVFKDNFCNKSEEDFDSLFDSFEDGSNVYYFECLNPKPYIIAFQADSEEELLKLFDPKLMALI